MLGSQISAFWQWAFSSLSDNTLRGHLLEWAVAHLLNIRMVDRDKWSAHDLAEGSQTIQVKQSSYLQGWTQRTMSKPRFTGLFVRPWDPETNTYQPPGFHCDWYIFGLLESTDADVWNPLDLDQWSFYIVPRATLLRHDVKQLGLPQLVKFVSDGAAYLVNAKEMRDRGRILMGLDAGALLVETEFDPIA